MLIVQTTVNVGASYAAAAFASSRPRTHAMALGLIRTGLIVLFPILHVAGQDMATPWYHLADLVLALPVAALGACIFELRCPPRPPLRTAPLG
jgi:hypothetical protein